MTVTREDAMVCLFAILVVMGSIGAIVAYLLEGIQRTLNRIERRLGIAEEATRGTDSVSTKTGAKMC